MKKTIISVALSFVFAPCVKVSAQAVPRKVVAEHFTNTYCSVCTARNPGYHTNLFHFPQVVHISYFPSSPYPACPVNQENKAEHDARTKFYGLYGGTPRIVIQGKVIPAPADYGDTALIHNELYKTSSFQMLSTLKMSGPSIDLTLTIIKKDTSSLKSLQLNAVLAEDTMMFTANNGEKVFYHVFKKNFSGTAALPVLLPSSVGDTVSLTLSVTPAAAWKKNRLFAVSTLQDADKNIVQADESGYLDVSTSVPPLPAQQELKVFPNPVGEYLYLDGYGTAPSLAFIYDVAGRQLLRQAVEQDKVYLGHLAAGTYWIRFDKGGGAVRIIKQ